MKSLKLVSVTATATAKDGREYYGAEFQDPSNPFARTVKRNFWQQKNAQGVAEWRGADPSVVKNFIGKTVPGEMITAKVEQYEIIGSDGTVRNANTFTTVILGNELAEQVFKSLGHPLAETTSINAPAVQEPADVAII